MKKLTSHAAGGVVVNESGEVVVVKQKYETWSLPKGHVELGEDTLTAARREIEEESGITDLELVKEFPSYERFKMKSATEDDETALKKLTFFLFKTKQKELAPQDPDNPEARWVKKTEVEHLLTHRKDKEFFRGILEEI